MSESQAGKGDRYRKVDRKKYEDGWERVFGNDKKCPYKGKYACRLCVVNSSCGEQK